jgi:hypothetical protein
MANPAVDADFQIATLAAGVGGLVTLRSLGIPNPHPIWKPGVASIDLGDNSARIMGAPAVGWGWGFISQSARDALRTFCTGASAPVIIVTPTTETVSTVPNASARYSCQMIWPAPNTPENPQAGRRLEFLVLYRQLVVI